jgi:hypothetical protein
MLENNIFWQNSAYYIGVGALSAQYQQNVVSLYNAFTTTLAPTQPQADATTAHGAGATITGGTGACVAASYWDIGVRGDTGPTNHSSGVTLAPIYSVLTSTTGYANSLNNTTSNPNFASQYCDGSRTPPEFGASGWSVPPGIADATVPNPIFNLTPVATVDEGNNWINMRWGPLSLLNPVTNTQLGNYVLTTGSPIIDYVPTSEANYALVPRTDFFGNTRPAPGSPTHFDPGAVEFQGSGAATAIASVTGGPLAFGSVPTGTTSTAQTLTLHNTGAANLTGITLAFSSPRYSRPAGAAGGTCTATLAFGATCTINVVFSPTAGTTVNATLTITGNVTVTGSPVSLSGTGVAPAAPTLTSITPATGLPGTVVPVTLTGTNLTGTTAVTVSGGRITVTGITVVNATTVKANFTIAANAALSARTVTVTTPGGPSNAVTFTVN